MRSTADQFSLSLGVQGSDTCWRLLATVANSK